MKECDLKEGLQQVSNCLWLYIKKKARDLDYLKALPRPCLEPRPPNGDEKKSGSVSKSNTFLSNRLSPISKNDANGLLLPKNCVNVARGSPWN